MHDDWTRLEDAVVAANFWMLDERGGRHGLDGSTWRFAGRRRHDYHYIARWSPDGRAMGVGAVSLRCCGAGGGQAVLTSRQQLSDAPGCGGFWARDP